MNSGTSSYAKEDGLVRELRIVLTSGRSPWQIAGLVEEFDFRRGRPDLVARTQEGMILSFEAKLRDWRRAMHQAYRNTCFAHESYVVMPRRRIDWALRQRELFERRKVGLCYVIPRNRLIIALNAPTTEQPIEPWLTSKAGAVIDAAAAA